MNKDTMGTPPAMEGTKICKLGCGRELHITAFYPHKGSRKDGRHYICIECSSERARKWREDPDNRTQWNRKRHMAKVLREHRITNEQYTDASCGGCGLEPTIHERQLVVDHCHATGEVRGLLCSECNLAVGNAQDSPRILRVLADYLDRYTAKK